MSKSTQNKKQMLTKKLALTALTLTLLTMANPALANLTLKMDLESRIQDKVRAILMPVDSAGQVVVSVKLQNFDLELPGMETKAVNVMSSSAAGRIDLDDVESVTVKILTRESELPAALKATIESAIDMPKSKKKFEYAQMDEATSAMILSQKNREDDQGVKQELSGLKDRFGMFSNGLFLIGALSLILISILGRVFFMAGKRSERIFEKMAVAGEDKVDHHDRVVNQTVAGQTSVHGVVASHHDAKNIHVLPVAATVSLFADCYWAEEDAYGAWLWSQFSMEQRSTVLHALDFAKDYAVYLSRVTPREFKHHEHPVYLNPLSVSHLSQADLFNWVKKDFQRHAHLSPIRQQNAPLTIEDKMKAFSARKLTSVTGQIQVPETSSVRRALPSAFVVGVLSESDELYIMSHAKQFEADFKSRIPTMAWFCLLPLKNRQELTNQLSAKSIAQALVGPSVFFGHFSEAVPEKKWKLVEQYAKKTTPSRDSDAFRFLFEASIQVQPSHAVESRNENKAA